MNFGSMVWKAMADNSHLSILSLRGLRKNVDLCNTECNAGCIATRSRRNICNFGALFGKGRKSVLVLGYVVFPDSLVQTQAFEICVMYNITIERMFGHQWHVVTSCS
jgi:hypothetical protein